VDPEMLGKVFEELVTGRHESGSYYTPRPIVSFMCREALKGYLRTQVPDLATEVVERYVDDHDVTGIARNQAGNILDALERITVVDPACGSGAYLLGMMQELLDLEALLYNQSLIATARSVYDMKLRIIQRNVYGADIDPFAVNIAMLRRDRTRSAAGASAVGGLFFGGAALVSVQHRDRKLEAGLRAMASGEFATASQAYASAGTAGATQCSLRHHRSGPESGVYSQAAQRYKGTVR